MKYGDRIEETTTTTGTGTLSLAGATAGHRTFVAEIGTATETVYVIEASDGGWEIGIGEVTAGTPDTLSRGFVLKSSNSDDAITLPAGTHTVRGTLSAQFLEDLLAFLTPIGIYPKEAPAELVVAGTYRFGPPNNRLTLTLTGNIDVELAGPGGVDEGYHAIVLIEVDATGGYTITWPGGLINWMGGAAPDLDMTANAKNVVILTYIGGVWVGDGGAL